MYDLRGISVVVSSEINTGLGTNKYVYYFLCWGPSACLTQWKGK